MKKLLCFAITLCMLLSLLTVGAMATGTTIYVDGSVETAGSGTQESPYETIQEAVDVANAGGDIVYTCPVRIGEACCATLEEAVTAAGSMTAPTITLLDDITLESTISLSSGELTIDLAGHTLKTADVAGTAESQYPTSKSVFSLSGTADLTIKDTATEKGKPARLRAIPSR